MIKITRGDSSKEAVEYGQYDLGRYPHIICIKKEKNGKEKV